MPRRKDTAVNPDYFKNQVAKDVSERELQEWVVDRLHMAGFDLVYHTKLALGSDAGFPDLVAAKRGAPVLFIECKSEKGQLTPGRLDKRNNLWLNGQDEWAAVLGDRADVRYCLVRPSTWLDGTFEAWLTGEV